MSPGRLAPGLVGLALALSGCVGAAPAPPQSTPVVQDAATAGASTTPAAPSATAAGTPSASVSAAPPAPSSRTPASDWRTGPTVAGFDVSRYNPDVDWAGLVASGHRFVYVKATEGTSYRSPTYAAQRASAQGVGLATGAYHYARPGASDGAAQARFFTANGGRWTADGRTLPGALDLEQSTSGASCHGLTPAAMRQWVRDFSRTYAELNGREPVVYVKAEVWRACVGDARDVGDQPLWLYDHDGGPDPLPAGWQRPTLWQRGVEAGLDRNVFFGTESDLARWASGN